MFPTEGLEYELVFVCFLRFLRWCNKECFILKTVGMLCWCFSIWLPVCSVQSWAELMCPVYLLQSGPDCWSCDGVDTPPWWIRHGGNTDRTRICWNLGVSGYVTIMFVCFLIHYWKVALFNKIHLKKNINLFQIINTDVFGFPPQFGKNSLMYLFPSDPHLVKPLLPETSNDCGMIKHESLIWTD